MCLPPLLSAKRICRSADRWLERPAFNQCSPGIPALFSLAGRNYRRVQVKHYRVLVADVVWKVPFSLPSLDCVRIYCFAWCKEQREDGVLLCIERLLAMWLFAQFFICFITLILWYHSMVLYCIGLCMVIIVLLHQVNNYFMTVTFWYFLCTL